MPLDGKIEQFTRAVPEGQEAEQFTLGSLIVWLETMPPKGRVNLLCIDGSCLIDQWRGVEGAWDGAPAWAKEVAYGKDGFLRWTTYGAALARARSLESAARQA